MSFWDDFWAQFAPPKPIGPPPFVPAYEQHYVYVIAPPGGSDKQPLNPWYFATEATAMETMKRLTADHIEQRPYGGAGGPNTATGLERWLVWRNGVAINAGLMASYWTRNPEGKYPGVALSMALTECRARGAA